MIVEKQVVVEKEVYRDVFVEVEVLHEGAERPPPLFKGGQSVHQWWANWMAGAYEVPAGIKGKNGRPAWYSASVFSWEQFCLQACRDAGVPGVALFRKQLPVLRYTGLPPNKNVPRLPFHRSGAAKSTAVSSRRAGDTGPTDGTGQLMLHLGAPSGR